jgi:hypothetical protein
MCGNNKHSPSQIRMGIVMNSLLARTNLSEAGSLWSNLKMIADEPVERFRGLQTHKIMT